MFWCNNGLYETMMLNSCQNNTGKILTACCVCIMGSIKFYYAKNNEVLPSSLSLQIAKLSLARNIQRFFLWIKQHCSLVISTPRIDRSHFALKEANGPLLSATIKFSVSDHSNFTKNSKNICHLPESSVEAICPQPPFENRKSHILNLICNYFA